MNLICDCPYVFPLILLYTFLSGTASIHSCILLHMDNRDTRIRRNRAKRENGFARLRDQPPSPQGFLVRRSGQQPGGGELAGAAKTQHRLLAFATAAKCRPAITPSLNSSRRRDSAADAESLDLDGCIHDSMRDPGLSPAALERVVGSVGGTLEIVQARGQRTNGLVGEGRGVRWPS